MRVGPRSGRWQYLLHGTVAVWLLLMVLLVAQSHGGRVSDELAGRFMPLFAAVGTAAAIRAATLRRLESRARRAWTALAAGFLMLLASCAGFAVVPGFPSPGDLARLAADPLLLFGLLMLTNSPRTRAERLRAGLDIGVIVAGGFMAVWFWPLGPLLTADSVGGAALAVTAAYPLGDLVLIFGAAAALLRGTAAATRRPLILAVLGLCALIAADLQYAGTGAAGLIGGQNGVRSSPVVQWMTLLTAFALLAAAAVQQCAGAPAGRSGRTEDRPVSTVTLLPYVAIACGYGLLLVVASGASLYPWGGLIVGAVVMTGLVVARQVVALRENHALLIADFLTGVATRPAFTHALSRSLARSARSGTRTAVLVIDMDGFKAVNDELGHDAGDELLVGFAGLLRGAVSRFDTVGRLGGDEFAVVLAEIDDPDDAVAVVLRLLDRMRTPLSVAGRPIVGRASIGIATSRPSDSHRDLLDRADQAMYQAKRGATGWSLAPDGTAGARPAPTDPVDVH